ncbi:CHAT domain-containing protein [Candidatus Leptofilum sp.]|uniref:CHAT domain-containing protein n=1 Tax=Candidatus Leptofilum sp. TaxID=3241576 RepID=UPI003B58F352
MVLIQDETQACTNTQPQSQTLTAERLVMSLLTLAKYPSQQQLLKEQIPQLNKETQDMVADLLKEKSDYFLRSNIQLCLIIADLLSFLADLTQNDWYRALGYRARANAYAHGGLGEYQQAIELYDQAAKIYNNHNHVVNQAGCYFAKLTPLAHLGRYDEAKNAGEWARKVFAEKGEWLLLAKVKVNLGLLYLRLGDDAQALDLFNKAQEIYLKNQASIDILGRVANNRAIALRNLGLFSQSIQTNEKAGKLFKKSGQKVEFARSQQTLGITYFILGRYNEGLELLYQAQEMFLSDGRHRDAILIELYISDCLLQLGRYKDVLENFQKIRPLFTRLGTQFEVAQCLLNEAVAHSGLRNYDQALTTLALAKQIFLNEGNTVWVATADLEIAAILLLQGQNTEGLTTSLDCLAIFESHNLRVQKAHAFLIASRAALSIKDYGQAKQYADRALTIGNEDDIPLIIYQGHYLLGLLAVEDRAYEIAHVEMEQAIAAIERLRGRLMLEFRSDFLLDKHLVYEDMVQLCLTLGEPVASLQYAERAKSRALLEMLAFRLDIGIQARAPEDQSLVDELTRLRTDRDRIYRRWVSAETSTDYTDKTLSEEQTTAQKDVQHLEKQITKLWHKLLIKNANYTQDASLWQVQTEPIQPQLDPQTVLLEFFMAKGKLIVFIVTEDAVQAISLPTKINQVQKLLQLFWLNLNAVPNSSPQRLSQLNRNAIGILRQLYSYLIMPFADHLQNHNKLIIVPHGFLHYLPFHALYDPSEPLLAKYEISYLPGANFIRYGRNHAEQKLNMFAIGHSYEGALPFAVDEAAAIGKLWSGTLLLEEEATLINTKEAASQSHILHLATHADFRPDNPLFSGLALADGWLTTLDIFNLKLNASLVTLSACQTGRSAISGGDELLGLMRAFLAAGASSLALTLWPVEDRSTAVFMKNFYSNLAHGLSKGESLRQAQLAFINTPDNSAQATNSAYHHPYFWAPFFLVGHAGHLTSEFV